MRSELRTRGEWPGLVKLRRGWAAAQARPWNDQTVELASLRLERGGDRFIGACVGWLAERGVKRVLSPAMPDDQSSVWRRAGFENHLELVVYEKDLRQPPPPPLHRVAADPSPDPAALAVIDDRAFDPTWRIGKAGLVDAMAATPTSAVLTVRVDGVVAGFAIVGEMAAVSYLQRLAVDPDHARRGIGRSLVRASVDWARRHGARTMVLNTQPENLAAARLYEDEGFVRLGARLRVLAKEGA
ncbi:MAG: GNAT family N-acetyltransferase [Actinomycetes bacterium]